MSQIIITTGMHRSGTSLVSSLLREAGVHVGDRMLTANVANPRGYFEDVDFYEFHEHLLHEHGQSYLYVTPDFAFEPTATEKERAQQLISERADRPVWGWKDPRTALFLDFWHGQLPEARYLFVYRHPLAVLLSLLRRGEFDCHSGLATGLGAWQTYNARIRAFYDEYPEHCVLVSIEALVGQFQAFSDLLRGKLGLNLQLDSEIFDRMFHAGELNRSQFPREVLDVYHRLFPEQVELLDELNRRANMPEMAGSLESASSPAMSALENFAAGLLAPVSQPVQQCLLQLLVSLIAPERTEVMLRRSNHNAKAAQQRIDQIWLYAQGLERLNMEQKQAIRDQDAQIQFQVNELQKRQQKLGQQAAQIKSLLAELNRIYETRTWKLIRTFTTLRKGGRNNVHDV